MKILITGHKGFIGQNMAIALADHDLSFYEWGDPTPEIRGLDWVIHLGAISSTTERNVEKIMKQNFDFSCWILQQCYLWKVNLQYASSAAIYGQRSEFKETSPVDPQSPYAWSKYLFERYAEQAYWDGIVVQGFRYFNVYGPHEDHKGSQASPQHQFIQQAKDNVIKVFKNSQNYCRDFVHVDTVVDVHQTFFNVNESGVWNVGTGTATSFQSVAESIAYKSHASIETIPMPVLIQAQYQTYTCADLTKLRMHYDKTT